MRRVNASKSIPQRGSRARQQDAQITHALIIAVHDDARQRRHALAMRGEQHAWTHRYRCPKTKFGGEFKLTRCRGGTIAKRIRQMRRLQPEGRFNH